MASPNNSDETRQAGLRDQSTGDLVKQLASETTTLVKQEVELARAEAGRIGEAVVTLARQELQLAKAEMVEKGRKAGPGFGMIAAAGAAGLRPHRSTAPRRCGAACDSAPTARPRSAAGITTR